MKYMLISGSPVYGFRYIGPFDGHKEAEEYAQSQNENISKNWWVTELLAPMYPKQEETPAK